MTGRGAHDFLRALPRGVFPGADVRQVVHALLADWDEDSGRGLVAIGDGDPTWVEVIDRGKYWAGAVGSIVLVLRNEWTGKASVILGAAGVFVPPPVEDTRESVGTVTAVSGSQITVTSGEQTYYGTAVQSYTAPAVGERVWLSWGPDGDLGVVGRLGAAPAPPAAPGAPSMTRSGGTVTVTWSRPSGVSGSRVRVSSTGGDSWWYSGWTTTTSLSRTIAEGQTLVAQVQVRNAGGTSDWSASSSPVTRPSAPAPDRPGGSAGGGKTETVTTTISPTDTGTYRVSVGRWDDWNRGRYGFPRTLYQGSKYGSGTLRGAAFYGTRITSLRALEILDIDVWVARNPLGEYARPTIALQGITQGTRPGGNVSTTGGTAQFTGTTGGGWVNLPSATRDAWRTGAIRGLVLVGSGYAAANGLGTAGMQLRIKFTRRV